VRRCLDERGVRGRPRKYDPQTNILWLKLTEASSDTSWFPIPLNQFSQSVDSTDQRSVVTAPVSLWP
jgi:hypothetical protein